MWRFVYIFLLSFFFSISVRAQEDTVSRWKITDLMGYISHSDTPLVVNFWATFCIPCIEEIPDFTRITTEYKRQGKNIKLLLVSLDLPSYYPQRIKDFAKKNNFKSDLVWLNETDADYFCPLVDTSWSGSIPATLFYNPSTGFRSFVEKQLTPAEFTSMLENMLRIK